MMNKKYNTTPELVVSLDIGTTKVVAIAGVLNEIGQVEVLGYGKVKSEGVLRGVVANIDKTSKAIADAIDMAERRAKYEFQVVNVGIAGQHIKSLHHRGIMLRDDAQKEISKQEVDKLAKDMYKLALSPGDQILHVIPQEFSVDEEEGILDPIGMAGARLEGNFHVITGKIAAANNILRCIKKAGIEVNEMILEPIGSASAVLSKEEIEAGVALVDIGGGTTDITIFQDGIIRHTAVIPFGGNIITSDIKEGCTVMNEQAEKLKVKFGQALADDIVDNRIITIPGITGRQPKEISEKNLARIIQARIEEILDYVVWEIRRSGYESKLIAGLVLTGGGALLKNIESLAESHTGHSTRIGIPTEYLAHQKESELSSPIFATAIGMLRYGLLDLDLELAKATIKAKQLAESEVKENNNLDDEEEEGDTWIGSAVNKGFKLVKDFFEATPDTDL